MPTTLRHHGHTLRLKWHKLRRNPSDPPFGRENLRAGLTAGASLEVDLQRLACGRLVCLHDTMLEGETTGQGRVTESDAEAVGKLLMRGADEPPMLLDELAELVRHGPCAPGTRIQLDLKATSREIDQGSAAMVAALRGVADRFILSGCDWQVVARLGGDIGGLALGYDPRDDLAAAGGDVYGMVRNRAPDADTVYLERGLVRAAHERGDPLVARLQEQGHLVDCWTIDHGTAEATKDLLAAIATGCDQITTNSAASWAAARL